MTFHSSTAGTLSGGFNLTQAVTSIVEIVSARVAAHRRYRAVRAELLEYAPEQLTELGISEADIDFVANAATRN